MGRKVDTRITEIRKDESTSKIANALNSVGSSLHRLSIEEKEWVFELAGEIGRRAQERIDEG